MQVIVGPQVDAVKRVDLEKIKQEVLEAQVVERWNSVWTGRGRTWAFFISDLRSIYSRWVSGFF